MPTLINDGDVDVRVAFTRKKNFRIPPHNATTEDIAWLMACLNNRFGLTMLAEAIVMEGISLDSHNISLFEEIDKAIDRYNAGANAPQVPT